MKKIMNSYNLVSFFLTKLISMWHGLQRTSSTNRLQPTFTLFFCLYLCVCVYAGLPVIFLCVYVCICVDEFVFVSIWEYICLCTHVCVWVFVYISELCVDVKCVCLCIFLCVCVFCVCGWMCFCMCLSPTTYMCVVLWVCWHASAYICICLYMHVYWCGCVVLSV